jgi:sec-independent protein translocase protein TatA
MLYIVPRSPLKSERREIALNIGLPELIVILIVALLVIGPKRLPEVAQALGKGLAEFKRAMEDVKDGLKVDDVKQDINAMKDSLLFNKSYEEEEKKETPTSGAHKEQSGGDSPQAARSDDPKTPVTS